MTIQFNLMLFCTIVIDEIHHGLAKPPLPQMQAHGTWIWHIQHNIIFVNTLSPLFARDATIRDACTLETTTKITTMTTTTTTTTCFFRYTFTIYKSLGLAWFGLAWLGSLGVYLVWLHNNNFFINDTVHTIFSVTMFS